MIGAVAHWTCKFSPIHTWWYGNDPVVNIADFESIYELIAKDGDSFSGRFFFDPIMEQIKDEFKKTKYMSADY